MKSRSLLNLTLGVTLLVLLGLSLLTRPDPARRNFEFLPDMMESIPYDSQLHNSNFADGMNLRLPAPGTIARHYPPLGYRATPEDALRAGEELQSPFRRDDAAALTRGEFVYETFCQTCHDPGGTGRGLVTARGVPPPPSLLAENARKMKDGQMFHVITFGQGNMPAYDSQVERADRWKAILHVRSLQEAAR